MSERKFIKNLIKPGSAAVLRENVSAAVRHSTLMVRPTICEPIDYESLISKYREVLQNDPQREILLFPLNDFMIKEIKNVQRTTHIIRKVSDYINDKKIKNPLYVQECINFFTSNLFVVTFQYGIFSGSWSSLPKICKVNDQANLIDQIYELDENELLENEKDLFEYNSIVGITKEGYILKAPEVGTDSFISIATKSYKRRWMSLRQELDGTSMLEFHKDSKKMEPKGVICLDFCNKLVKISNKKVKFLFELHMNEGHKTCILAAENENDFENWIDVLTRAINSKIEANNRKSLALPEEAINNILPSKQGFLQSIDLFDHPELIKYYQENEYSINEQRKENRINICSVFPDLYIHKGPFSNLNLNDLDYKSQPYKENFGFRFKLTCTKINFNLKTMIEGTTCLAEPLFTSISIFDTKRGKLTEEFRFDLNDNVVKDMLPKETDENENLKKQECESYFNDEWITNPKSGIFSVHNPTNNMYLVIRIEKIFSGGITSTSEAYLKSVQNGNLGKLGNKLHKSAKATCQKMNNLYRMPFAWAAKPLFKENGILDQSPDFNQIYRQDSNKLSDEELIKHLIELQNTEKLKNITLIPGKISISIEKYNSHDFSTSSPSSLPNSLSSSSNESTCFDFTNLVNSSHIPLVPFTNPPTKPATIEIQEFLNNETSTAFPFISFINLLYVFPKQLKYDAQKLFPKTKNICCVIEFRDSDLEDATSLNVIFGSPGRDKNEFVSKVTTAITHHNNNPEFYEEVKILLPTILNDKQHLLFSFYHVSSSSLSNKKKDGLINTPIGYSWAQIYPLKGKLAIEEVNLPISSHLPSGYLSYKPLGLGHGFAGPDIKWIDNGKESFKVEFKLISSVFPQDSQLHSFFVHVDKILDFKSFNEETASNLDFKCDTISFSSENKRLSMCSDINREISKFVQIQQSMPKLLKTLQDTKICDLIRFFPILLSELLKLLITTTSKDVAQYIVKIIIHILDSLEQVGKKNVIESYIDFVFTTSFFTDIAIKTTLHEEIILSLVSLLKSTNQGFVSINKLLENCWFFFRICIKSMICHLLETNRIKMHRHERFSNEFHESLCIFTECLIPEIMKKYNLLPNETKSANQALSHFFVRLFSLMDRGFVFKLIKLYLDQFHSAKDSITLHTYKFEFLAIITSYEHFIPLNLPINFKQFTKSTFDNNNENLMEITDEFCKNHFLIGVLLQEVRAALSEIHQVRVMAISILRNLIVKHSIDERYQSKYQQTRIASLYFPFITLLIENISRIHVNGFRNTFLPPTTCGPIVQKPELSSINSSLYSLNTIGTDTISSRTSQSSKRVSFTDKFNSLNNETSKLLVQSLKRNSSLESTLNITAQRDSMNLIAEDIKINSKTSIVMNDLFELNKELNLDDLIDEINSDKFFKTKNQNENGNLSESRSVSPYSPSSSSSTTTLTPNNFGQSSNNNDIVNNNVQSQTYFHQRTQSFPIRFDKLNNKEVRDLLIIFLWITKNLNEEILISWIKQTEDNVLIQVLTIAEMCLHEFKYNGRKTHTILYKNKTEKSLTLPSKISSNFFVANSPIKNTKNLLNTNVSSTVKRSDFYKDDAIKSEDLFSSLLEANLTAETGLIILDLISVITTYFYLRLTKNESDNDLMKKVFSIYLTYFQFKQSDKLLLHLFASLRLFIAKFSNFLFSASIEYIGKLCLELLRFCSSRIAPVRSGATILIYLLLKANFNYTHQSVITRMHLQLIISISQLLGDSNINYINNARFQESLSLINNYAITDKSVKSTKFSCLTKDLIKNIRTVLMATIAMREHEDDPEKLIDLQHHLANSYSETSPALRRTWLESMAKNHVKNGNLSEAAHCLAHICALEFECLRVKFPYLSSAKDFAFISPNILRDEKLFSENSNILNNDVYSSTEQQFTQELLIKNLKSSIEMFAKAERFEVIPELYKLLIPMYERKREYEILAKIHKQIAENYEKIILLKKTGKRFLGSYFKVSFYRRDYFEEDSGKEFIYKEEKVTSLSEILQRLREQYGKKYGSTNIKLIQSEKEVDEEKDCDPKYGYIQVTHVVPFNQDLKNENSSLTCFEKVNNICKFMFETPFCMSDESKARSETCEDQAKKRTICTTDYLFPYVEKRILVTNKHVEILTPIEVAIDEMTSRVNELNEVIRSEVPDVKKLHLKLGGSISVQVNAGPLAYAKAFINNKYPVELVQKLINIYQEFIDVCELGLNLNEKLVGQEQYQYHVSLQKNFNTMVQELSTYCFQEINNTNLDKVDIESSISNKSYKIFDYISGSSKT